MRILHVIPQFPYFGGRAIVGGHASSLLTLSLAQAEAGDEVTILSYVERSDGTTTIDGRVGLHTLFENGDLRTALPGPRIVREVKFGLQFARAAVRWVRARRQQFDLVHFHSGYADYLLVSGRLKRTVGLPSVHTMYCAIPTQGGRWRLPFVHGLINRRAAAVDALGAISRNVADSMRSYGLREARVIAPPIDIDRFSPPHDVPALRAELGLREDAVVVLFVGNAKTQKNMAGVLQATHEVRKRHENVQLVITTELAQSASDEQLQRLRRQMVELGLERHVLQMGIVKDMARLMQACDILVAPFLSEWGISDYFLAVLEAMACGKPSVTSAVGGMPEIITAERGRLVDPHDHRHIAAAMEELVADAGLRRAIGDAARAFAEQHFDPRHIAASYRKLYSEVMP